LQHAVSIFLSNTFSFSNRKIPNQNGIHSVAFLPWFEKPWFGPAGYENAWAFYMCKWPVATQLKSQRVNFINILLATPLFKSTLQSFFVHTVWIAYSNRLKTVCDTLVKLTIGKFYILNPRTPVFSITFTKFKPSNKMLCLIKTKIHKNVVFIAF